MGVSFMQVLWWGAEEVVFSHSFFTINVAVKGSSPMQRVTRFLGRDTELVMPSDRERATLAEAFRGQLVSGVICKPATCCWARDG